MTFDVGHRVIVTNFDWGMFTPREPESLNGAYGFVTHTEKPDSFTEAMVFVQLIETTRAEPLDCEDTRKPWPFWERELQHAD